MVLGKVTKYKNVFFSNLITPKEEYLYNSMMEKKNAFVYRQHPIFKEKKEKNQRI